MKPDTAGTTKPSKYDESGGSKHRRASSNRRRITCGILGALVLLATGAGGVHAAVGAKIGLQTWNPATGDERVEIPYNHSSSVSDAVIQAWDSARDPLCAKIKDELGKGDRFAEGVTLYKIECTLKSSQEFSVKELSPGKLEFTYAVRGNWIKAKATTPTFLNSDFDPEVSVTFDFVVRLGVAVQPATDKTIEVTEVHGRIENARPDSHNMVGDVLKLASDISALLGGPNFVGQAEHMLNSVSTETQYIKDENGQYVRDQNGDKVSYGTSFKDQANAKFEPINKALTAPAYYVKIGAWFHKNQVVLAFSPRNIPQPQLNGKIEGRIRWPQNWTEIHGCDSFDIKSEVKTGPGTITGPDFKLAAGPVQEFGQYRSVGVPVQNGNLFECHYTITGVPGHYANMLTATILGTGAIGPGPTSASGRIARLDRDGWYDNYVTPALTAYNRNYELRSTYIGPKTAEKQTGPKTAEKQTPFFAGSRVPAVPGLQVIPHPPRGPTDRIQPGFQAPTLTKPVPAAEAIQLRQPAPASQMKAPMKPAQSMPAPAGPQIRAPGTKMPSQGVRAVIQPADESSQVAPQRLHRLPAPKPIIK